MSADLPKMPPEGIKIDVGVLTATLDYDSTRFRSGSMRLTIEDVCARVREGDKEIGQINGCIGGGVQFVFDVGPEGKEHIHFFLPLRELWKLALVIKQKYEDQQETARAENPTEP